MTTSYCERQVTLPMLHSLTFVMAWVGSDEYIPYYDGYYT